jgi:hypothetical protein
MSLPPDPHDDDVDTPAADPDPPPPPAPPSPAYEPPASPAYKPSTRPGAARVGDAPPSLAGTSAAPPAGPPAAHLAPDGTAPSRGRGWIVAAGLAAAAVVAVVAAVFVLGGDDDEPSAGGGDGASADTTPVDQGDALAEPVDVATAFFGALESRDCARMIELLTPGSLFPEEQSPEDTLSACQEAVDSGATGFEGVEVGTITLASVEGEVATVSVDFDLGGQPSTEQFELHRVDGQWRLDLPGSA